MSSFRKDLCVLGAGRGRGSLPPPEGSVSLDVAMFWWKG